MKKNLLLGIAICMGSLAFGQNSSSIPSNVKPLKINRKLANLAMPLPKRFDGVNANAPASNSFNGSKHYSGGSNALNSTGSADSTIGSSIYDLQTNSSVCNRMVLNSDGTVSATWTMSHNSSGTYSDRGTGYTYFNDTNWTFGAGIPNISVPPALGPQTKLEMERVGWPNMAVAADSGEVIVSHQAGGSGFGLDVLTRHGKGHGAWTEQVLAFDDVWPRMVVGGANHHTIHMIASTLGLGTTPIIVHGQNGSIGYFRSQDWGHTWDIENALIPQIDSSHYLGFGGDDYAMDAKGDTIAIVLGGNKVDVVLLKSTDNGTTWTSTIVHKFPIPLFDPTTMYTDTLNPLSGAEIDTLESNDGSVSVLLDHNGMAHVWYGRMLVVESSPGTAATNGLDYFPGTDGLMYWDENMGAAAPVEIAAVQDVNHDGTLDVYVDPSGASLGFGTYYVSLSSMPSAGIDAAGRIYLSYASIYDGLNQSGNIPTASNGEDGKSYRHTYLMSLEPGSSTWCNPIDITDSTGQNYMEGVFGAMTRRADGFVHVLVQNDNAPGDALAMNSSNAQIDQQGTSESDMVYYAIPYYNVTCDGEGVSNIHPTVGTINLFPNPASNSVTIQFSINKASKADVKIYNIMGQEVTKFDNQPISNGTTLNINLANYPSGIYFVNSVIDGKSYSKKLIVE